MNSTAERAGRFRRLARALKGWRLRRETGAAILLVIAVLAMGFGYNLTARQVTVVVDGRVRRVRLHQRAPMALLQELGLALGAQDRLELYVGNPVGELEKVVVVRALPVKIRADGNTRTLYTHSRRLSDVLSEAGLRVKPYDRVLLEDAEVPLDTPLTRKLLDTLGGWGRLSPAKISLRRAVPFTVVDEGVPLTLYTTAETVGEALHRAGIILYEGDRVSPPPDSPVSSGLRVYIKRSKGAEILVDGRRIKTRTLASTVAELLAQEGVALFGRDYTIPSPDAPVRDGLKVKVVRVREAVLVEEEPIPFETVWKPDEKMELDTQRVVQQGEEGIYRRLYRVIYENGREKSRRLEDEWVARKPVTRVIAYGTKIVIRELETPEGTIKYWRRIRMLATSYTAATSGKSRDHPLYGITRLGMKARKGIVAVDPRVINLGTRVYVPGYGLAVAGDTGGKIKGRRIDLCYDEDNLVLWYKWVDVYLLAPPPPRDKIIWLLPNWPREHRRR